MFATYTKLLDSLLVHGVEELNERTGRRVRIFPHAAAFTVDMRSGRLPLPGNRRVYPATAAKEIAWFVLGQTDVDFLERRGCKIWSKFALDGRVDAAYGYRWRFHFGRDQLELALSALRANPSDRRIWVSAWDPAVDGLGAKGQTNVPCPVGFSLSIVGGALNMAVMVRSSDVFVGLPYDVMGHAMLLDMFARSLGIDMGWMHFTLAHPHLYDVHYDMARESLKATWAEKPIMPRWSLLRVENNPDGYIAEVAELSRRVRWPEYDPRPELVL